MRKHGVWIAGWVGALALLLASCASNPLTTGEPVAVAGVVASDGTLAGLALDTSSARITQDGEPTDASLKPGAVVSVEGTLTGGQIRVASADLKIELKGQIEAIDLDAGTLTVLGTPVRVDALTRIEEEDGTSLALADLEVGDFVEVSGVREADGTVLATRIERKAYAESEVEAKGFACQLDADARTFALWRSANCADPAFDTGISVDYESATLEGTPAEGARVEVEGTLEGSLLTATEVEFKGRHGHDGDYAKIELYGPIASLDEEGLTFELLGYLVDYRSAEVEGSLAEGAYVKVEGRPDAEDPTLVHAYEVEVKYPEGPRDHVPSHEVKGRIEAIDPEAMTLTVAGVDLYADEYTILKEDDPDRPIAFADLAAGDWVEVKYDATAPNEAGAYYAVKIEKKNDEGASHELEGYVQNLDREGRTFEVGGVLVTVDEATRYKDDRADRHLSADAFWSLVQEGDRVEVKGTYQEASLLASKIELKNDD
ncbi:MAG TPA: hypothetical protein ENJ76_02110 [Oceanithermus sp.]|nr:hypothetical protein [Oceanithermus sp.]